MHLSHSNCWLAAAFLAALAIGFWCPLAMATDGLQITTAFEQSSTSIEYEKSVVYNSPPSAMTAGDRIRDATGEVKAALGYRWPLTDRLYAVFEVEAAYPVNGDADGFLEGTGDASGDVWPGAWRVDNRSAAGINARLGFVPAPLAFLGSGRSLYLFAGARWIDVDIKAAHLNQRLGIAGAMRADRTLNPWVAGAGVEFGNARRRFDLRLSRAVDRVNFYSDGEPRLGYAFKVRVWSLSLGYVLPLWR